MIIQPEYILSSTPSLQDPGYVATEDILKTCASSSASGQGEADPQYTHADERKSSAKVSVMSQTQAFRE